MYTRTIIERSLEVKLRTIWTDEKAEVGGEEKWRSEKRKSQRKEDAGARKGSKVPKHCVFQWFVAPEGRKVGSLKRRVRSHLARWEMKSCTPLWREAHFEVKRAKKWRSQTTFGSWDVEKVHTVVARSTFPSQNVENTPGRSTFGTWDVEIDAVVARSTFPTQNAQNNTKHARVGALLEAEMSKKCTPLWREAHFEVKSVKNWRSRSTFASWDVDKCTPLWREAHFQVKMLKAPHVRTTFESSDVVLRGRCEGSCTMPKVSKTWRVL